MSTRTDRNLLHCDSMEYNPIWVFYSFMGHSIIFILSLSLQEYDDLCQRDSSLEYLIVNLWFGLWLGTSYLGQINANLSCSRTMRNECRAMIPNSAIVFSLNKFLMVMQLQTGCLNLTSTTEIDGGSISSRGSIITSSLVLWLKPVNVWKNIAILIQL